MADKIELGEKELKTLNNALELIEAVEPFMEKAKMAKHDVTVAEAKLKEYKQKIRLNKETFFPGR